MPKPIDENKVVVFTGAGISAASGLKTFRDSDGLWNNHAIEDVATPYGWENDPQRVLDFYNSYRVEASRAEPNLAHLAIASLEKKFTVIVITQNVDGLHERAGSSNVIHLHGELSMARSTTNDQLIYNIGNQPINLGDHCDEGSQLRPHIVWFGEKMLNNESARQHLSSAARVLVIGSSLSVEPAASLLKKARFHAEKIIVSLDIDKKPFGFYWLRAEATKAVPHIVEAWSENKSAIRKA